MDRWTDQAAWTAFLEEFGDAYERLDARMAPLTASERPVLEGST